MITVGVIVNGSRWLFDASTIKHCWEIPCKWRFVTCTIIELRGGMALNDPYLLGDCNYLELMDIHGVYWCMYIYILYWLRMINDGELGALMFLEQIR